MQTLTDEPAIAADVPRESNPDHATTYAAALAALEAQLTQLDAAFSALDNLRGEVASELGTR